MNMPWVHVHSAACESMPGVMYAHDERWEPYRRISWAFWLARTHSRQRVYHALHMIATGEF